MSAGRDLKSESKAGRLLPQRWIVALTGASGLCYGIRLIEVLATLVEEVHIIASDAALRVLQEEEGKKLSRASLTYDSLVGSPNKAGSKIFFHNPRDIAAAPASGTARFEGMIIAPCSMGTLGAIAQGIPSNLVHRAADVTLKEGRKLVIVPRETPLSAIHLENMLKLSKLGVSIAAAMPGFYHKPIEIVDLVDMMVMKILDQIGIRCDLVARWGSTHQPDNNKDMPVKVVGADG